MNNYEIIAMMRCSYINLNIQPQYKLSSTDGICGIIIAKTNVDTSIIFY